MQKKVANFMNVYVMLCKTESIIKDGLDFICQEIFCQLLFFDRAF